MFRRQVSKCVGRGALWLGTEKSLPIQKLDIPKICLNAFIAVSAQGQMDESELRPTQPPVISVELKTKEEKQSMQWPEFHNGVAAALKIAETSFSNSHIKNTRNWIMYHRPQNPKNEHGGFLLGLGLLGQLGSLQETDVYQHLKNANDSTTIGIMLGLGASKIGKMDENDSKMMCLHIPSLLPPNLSMDYSLSV
jgi:anaphase-promoting complex subunit 1